MKKLLTAAVASTFAFLAMGVVNGDEINQGADFEASDFVSGEAFNAALDDEAEAYGDKFWYTEDTEADNIISNYPSTGTGVPIASRPDKFASNSNSKYLRVETTGKLWRSVKNNGGSSDFLTNTTASLDVYGYSITNSAIYLDTLVKFTPADGEFAADALSDGDKIAISYVEHEADTDGDVSYTNFVIRAGLIRGSELFQTNYFAYLPDDPTFANFDKDAWHRLTVRTIPDVGDGSVGFVVYVDETNLTYSADVDAGFGTLNATAQGFYDNTKHALFPSAIPALGTGGKMISAASFSGNGSLDDVVFTTTTPEFIKATESVVATINLGPGISGVTVSVSGTPVEPADSAANPLVFNLAPGTTDFTLAVTADTANGYTFDDATGITAENASYANGTVTISGGSPALTVVGKRDNAYYMDGETKVGFDTLSEALSSAPADATIKLGYNYSATKDVVSDDAPVFVIAKNIVLDLNGKELDGGSGNARALFSVNLGCVLTVIDSVPGDGGSIIYGGTFGMFAGDGDTIIGSDADYGPVIIGAAIGDGGYISEIVRGKFSAAENTTADDEFVCGTDDDTAGINVIADDSTFSRVGDYWVVEPQGGSTTFALTTTGGANATVTTSPANVSALTEATEVTITSTADQDYTYDGVDLTGTDWTYDSQTDAISMTTNISENTTVVVPDAVSEQSSEDWPEGQDLDDVAGKAAGDQFPGITNALATADAKAVATWAEAKGVAYADKGGILPEAFLLDCANTQAAIDEAAANFKVTAITVVGDTVTITPADGADYGNGKVVIEGTATLSPISWHEKTDGDHFFRATLVVKPVAAP